MRHRAMVAVAAMACCVIVVLLASQETADTTLLEVIPAMPPVPAKVGENLPQLCGGTHAIPPLKAPKEAPEGGHWELKHASIFTRHGDRMRAGFQTCWPQDTAKYDCDLTRVQTSQRGAKPQGHVFKKKYLPGRNVLPGTCHLGQLTPIGFQQQVANGRMLRTAYQDLLPAEYNREEISLRSDDAPRTILSGQALFNGLYPPTPADKKDHLGRAFLNFLGAGAGHGPLTTEVEWNVMDHVKENLFPNFHVCPRLNRAVKTGKESAAYKKHLKEVHDPLKKKVARLLGLKGPSAKALKLHHLLDCMQTHICHGQPLPKALAAPGVLPELIANHGQHYDLVMGHGLATRYAGGPLVGEVLQMLTKVKEGRSPLKLALFSGHDTGPILPLLHAFKVHDGTWPAYASLIALELYTNKGGRHAVRMVYNGKALSIPGCGGELCPWEAFVRVAQAQIPKKGECVDEELGGKLIHWMGMFMMADRLDVTDADVAVSGGDVDL